MSIQFNDTTTYKGLVQIYEKEIGANRGDVSGNTDRLKEFAADANLALDDFWAIAIPASGKWQLDDINHTSYPFILGNITNGQRDYPFTADGSGNLILDIYKVMVADANGLFTEIKPVDQQSDEDMADFYDGQNRSGVPTRYDKTANGIIFDLVPNYDESLGLKVFINREASYFTYTDTTKKPGVTGIFHRYFAIKPAVDYARIHTTTNHDRLKQEVMEMEAAIRYHYAGRDRGTRRAMRPNLESNK